MIPSKRNSAVRLLQIIFFISFLLSDMLDTMPQLFQWGVFVMESPRARLITIQQHDQTPQTTW
jgi:hypothetical protein